MRLQSTVLSVGRRRVALWFGHASTSVVRTLAVSAGLLVVAMLAWRIAAWHNASRVLTQASARIAQAYAASVPTQSAGEGNAPAVGRGDAARFNTAVAQLNTPWSDVFDGLERVAQPDVGLTMIEPDAKNGRLRVQAEARDADVLFGYAQHLATDGAFDGLRLLQHETNEQDAYRPARLTFEVGLRTATGPAAEEKP